MKSSFFALFAFVSAAIGQQTTNFFVKDPSWVTITFPAPQITISPTNTPPPTNPIPPIIVTGFFSATNGSAANDGSQTHPWDLQTGLTRIATGQTLWLRGGIYRGQFRSTSRATAASPARVRQFPGERATLDGKGYIEKPILSVAGVNTWFLDFEVMNSQTNRYSPEGGSHPTPGNMPNIDGIQTEQTGDSGSGCKFINLVIHDTRQGISLWKEAADAEVYGCLIYYNGWLAPDRGHGYATYQQNQTGRRGVRNCFFWSGFESGFVGYGSDAAPLKNFDLDQNTIFNCGALGVEMNRDILLGGGQVVENSNIRSNSNWYATIGDGTTLNLGYADAGAGSVNCIVSWNQFLGGKAISVRSTNLSLVNNFIAGSPVNFPAGSGNTIQSTMPADLRVWIRPNQYTPGRTHVTVYSGGNATTATLSAAALGLVSGDRFEQRSVQNYYGSAQQRLVSGATVSLDLNSGPIAQPSGWTATGTAPRFNGFVIQKL